MSLAFRHRLLGDQQPKQYALSFNRTLSNYIETDNIVDNNSISTVVIEYQTNNQSSDNMNLFTCDRFYLAAKLSSNTIGIFNRSSVLDLRPAAANFTWSSIAFLIDRASNQVKAVLNNSDMNWLSYTIGSASSKFIIGANFNRSTYYGGLIASIHTFDRVLTLAEISDYKNIVSGLNNKWEINEGSGSRIYNSLNANHGTIYGAQWVEL